MNILVALQHRQVITKGKKKGNMIISLAKEKQIGWRNTDIINMSVDMNKAFQAHATPTPLK
jgi:hypothetical protein